MTPIILQQLHWLPVEHRITHCSWLQLHHSTSIRRPFDVELKSNLNCGQRITNFVSLMCYVNNGLATSYLTDSVAPVLDTASHLIYSTF